MPKQEIHGPEDRGIEAEVSSGLDEAKQFAKSLDFDEAKSGEWFINLLLRVASTYDRNARAEYFQQKYPGLPPDEIADILTSVTVRYATIAGAVAGATATANQIAGLASAGMTAPLFLGSIGAEMIYLARIQMRLVLDLSVVYDLRLDPEDPEDVLMVFGYALGVAPTEALGKGVQVAARAGATGAVKKYISKGTLKAVQDFARRLGFKILQRTLLKYAVPVASAAVGSSYNYVATRSVGRIAKTHFKNRGKASEELRALVSRQNTYDLAFPAAVMYLAQVDGELSAKEKELYRAMLSRMSFDDHTQAEFQRLMASEENTIEAAAQIEDGEVRQRLVETLVLVAAYDGELAEEEREFLTSIAGRLDVPLDLDDAEKRAKDYQAIVEQNIFGKSVEVAGGAATRAIGVAGQTAGSVRDTATMTRGKVKGVLGKALKRRRGTGTEELPAPESPTVTCSSCGRELPAEYRFCPGCGQQTVSEKACSSCSESIPVDSAFCPHCGASQK